MEVRNYLIDQQGKDWSTLLSDWAQLLPAEFTLWLVNRFGDVFLIDESGSVQMLDVGLGKLTKLANSRDEFADLLDVGNNANDWLMIPVVDRCVAGGQQLAPNQCYGFKVPPIFGGSYEPENVEPTDISVHYSLLAQIYLQTKDLPDGTRIKSASIR